MGDNLKESELKAKLLKAKLLKASIAEFIGPLLKRLELTKDKVPKNSEMVEIIDKIIREVKKKKDSADSIQNRDVVLIGYFENIERQINFWIDDNGNMAEMNESTVRDELMDILNKLAQTPSGESSVWHEETKITEGTESPNRSDEEIELSMDLKDLETLDVHSSLCLYSLGIFPESTALKKRFVIYWWTGLGLLPWFSWEKAELHGHNIFSDLVNKGFLKHIHSREHNNVIDRCTINPTIHKWLLSGNEKNDLITYSPFFGDWFNKKILVNLDQRYLNSKDISTKIDLQIIQLGRWRHIETEVHNRVEETGSKKATSNDHIEVDETGFLKNLGRKATYISLQGISGIEEVHESIGKLENLMILDLRACHNLNKLPQKPKSTLKQKLIRWKLLQKSWLTKLIGRECWFEKLTILDISECYLLDHMPKWVCEISNLEVLKGFVLGSMGNKNQSCRLRDLSKLNKLRKLSIRVSVNTLDSEVFRDFDSIESLLVLTIIWGVKKYNKEIPSYSLPKNLEKLDIQGYPEANASKLKNPEKLKNLKRLYFRGGNLENIPFNDNWKVEILRLRFMKKLDPTDWNELRRSFKYLRYVEYVECPKAKNFPNDGISWSREKDEQRTQSGKDKKGKMKIPMNSSSPPSPSLTPSSSSRVALLFPDPPSPTRSSSHSEDSDTPWYDRQYTQGVPYRR